MSSFSLSRNALDTTSSIEKNKPVWLRARLRAMKTNAVETLGTAPEKVQWLLDTVRTTVGSTSKASAIRFHDAMSGLKKHLPAASFRNVCRGVAGVVWVWAIVFSPTDANGQDIYYQETTKLTLEQKLELFMKSRWKVTSDQNYYMEETPNNTYSDGDARDRAVFELWASIWVVTNTHTTGGIEALPERSSLDLTATVLDAGWWLRGWVGAQLEKGPITGSAWYPKNSIDVKRYTGHVGVGTRLEAWVIQWTAELLWGVVKDNFHNTVGPTRWARLWVGFPIIDDELVIKATARINHDRMTKFWGWGRENFGKAYNVWVYWTPKDY